MSELTCLELSVVLWVAYLLCQVFAARAEFGDAYLFSPRDVEPTPKGLLLGRATRAFRNYTDNMVPFLAIDLALIAIQHTGGIGATIWILARTAYLPAYLQGAIYVRTACWGLAIVGLLMMLGRLLG
jgi:uncharacterized MAPEG superfamily protein